MNCSKCGKAMGPEERFCSNCGAPRMEPAAGTRTPVNLDGLFRASQEAFARLKGQLDAGRITRVQFEAELQKLAVQDAQSRYWSLGAGDGTWQYFDGSAWVRGNPYDAASGSGVIVPPPSLPEARFTAPSGVRPVAVKATPRRRWPLLAVLLLVLVAGLGGAALIFLLGPLPAGPLGPGAAQATSAASAAPGVAVALTPASTTTTMSVSSPAPTGTPTSSPTSTPTNTPTNTSTPTPVPDLQVVFTDDFTSACGLWQGDDANNTMKCENGEYTILAKVVHWNRWVNYTLPYTNVIVEANARVAGGTGFVGQGLIFGVSSDSLSGDAMVISERGQYILYRFSKSGSVVLNYWTTVPAIKTDGTANRLKVVVQGTQIAVYVNDQWLNTYSDPAYAGGRIGFILSNDEIGAKAAFDSVRVTQINRALDLPSPLPATATATRLPPTATSTPTSTSTPTPTATSTATAVPPTATATATPDPIAKLHAQLDAAWAAGDWQKVIALLEALRVLDPTDLTLSDKLYAARVNYGLQLLAAGNFAGALAQCQAALTLNPSGGEALQCIARAQPKPTATQYVPPYIPPAATATTAPPPPAATPTRAPIDLYVTVRGYEQWGRPNPSCADGFNDKSPVRKFTVDLTIVNRSSQPIGDWYPDFYAGGKELYTCYYGYDEASHVPGIPGGATRTVTFAAFAELSEYVTDMSLWLNSAHFTACFAPYDGHLVPCP